jgi:DMSO/TMAO reductase YedYZ molybdopterin-dependent catalytic subunit
MKIMKTVQTTKSLPLGQKEIEEFPRFGLSQYAKRYRENFGTIDLDISGEVKQSFKITYEELEQLNRSEMTSDFHCVTTWTKCNLHWSGYRFVDFFEQLIKPHIALNHSIHWVIFKSLDGYRSRILLSDILNSDSLLADELNGEALCSKHGAPIRLVAPAHYGYKNPKHLKAIEFHTKDYCFKPPLLSFMEHPRGRVEFEERGQFLPGWFLRLIYQPLIKSTIKKFEFGMLAKNK